LLDPTSRNCRLILQRIFPFFPTFLTRYSLQSLPNAVLNPCNGQVKKKKTNEEEKSNVSENLTSSCKPISRVIRRIQSN